MRIAIVHSHLGKKGGAENIIILLANSLGARGHEVVIFTRDYSEKLWGNPETQKFSIRFIHTKLIPKPLRNIWLGIVLGWKLKKFDFVNPHNYPSNVWTAYARHFYSHFPPIVWFCHEPPRSMYYHLTETHKPELFIEDCRTRKILDSVHKFFRPYRKNFEKKVDKWASTQYWKILSNSAYTASLIEKVYGLRAHVCLLGIPLTTYQGNNIEVKNRSYASVVTRLRFHKNVDTILKAVSLVIHEKKINDFYLKIVGEGPETEKLEKLAQSLNIASNVEFLGFISEENLKNHYAKARFVIYVPLNEPFGLVTLEAMANGTPTIGTNDAGPGEVIEDGITGLTVNPLDERALAGAISRLWQDPDLCERLGLRARKAVEDNYNSEAFANRFLSAIQETIKKEI
ncbi:MAG: glycosyltransferase family 4 protein [bacterium]